MTAHDDVVAAVEAWAIPVLDKYGDLNPFDFDELVAAIPSDVLVRLAIERGALVEYQCTAGWNPTVYEVVES